MNVDIDQATSFALDQAIVICASLTANNWNVKNFNKKLMSYTEEFLGFLVKDNDVALPIKCSALAASVKYTEALLGHTKDIGDDDASVNQDESEDDDVDTIHTSNRKTLALARASLNASSILVRAQDIVTETLQCQSNVLAKPTKSRTP